MNLIHFAPHSISCYYTNPVDPLQNLLLPKTIDLDIAVQGTRGGVTAMKSGFMANQCLVTAMKTMGFDEDRLKSMRCEKRFGIV